MISLKTNSWEIENIKTVIFDKDGTLIDLNYFWGKMTELRASEVIKKYGIDEGKFSKLCLDLGFDANTKKMIPTGITALYSRSKIIEIFKQNLFDIHVRATTQELEEIFDYVSNVFYQNIMEYTKPIPNVIDFIKKLYSLNIKLGIVTSDSVESTNLTLKNLKWDKYFTTVIGRESTNETKESGIPTLLALKNLKSNPNETIMIGDAPMDSISAHNANIERTILVSTGQLEIEELKKHSKYTLSNLSEIKILD